MNAMNDSTSDKELSVGAEIQFFLLNDQGVSYPATTSLAKVCKRHTKIDVEARLRELHEILWDTTPSGDPVLERLATLAIAAEMADATSSRSATVTDEPSESQTPADKALAAKKQTPAHGVDAQRSPFGGRSRSAKRR